MIALSSIDDPQVEALLRKGAVGVIPTDTVYGLAARAKDKSAVARLYALKQRENKPGTVIAADVSQLVELGVDEAALAQVAELWPNPLSVVIKSSPALEYIHLGVGSLAVRIPNDEKLRKLLAQTGPLITSSANHPGKNPASTLAEAQAYFGNDVDFYVDGGDLSGRQPSTVAMIENGQLKVLRQGSVNIAGN